MSAPTFVAKVGVSYQVGAVPKIFFVHIPLCRTGSPQILDPPLIYIHWKRVIIEEFMSVAVVVASLFLTLGLDI